MEGGGLEQLKRIVERRSFTDYIPLVKRGIELFVERMSVEERERFREVIPKLTSEATVRTVAKGLWDRWGEVIYPVTLKPVPRYPLSKVPIIEWSELQELDWSSEYVAEVKYICSKLGTLINCGFVLDRWTLIDVEVTDPELRAKLRTSGLFDVETRRGFHKYFHHPDYIAVALRWGSGGEDAKLVLDLETSGIRIEVKSGWKYLGTYPPQSTYIQLSVNGGRPKVCVHRYDVLSKEMRIMVESGDTDLLVIKRVDDVVDFLVRLLEVIGRDDVAKNLEKNVKARFLDADQYRSLKPKLPTGDRDCPVCVFGSLTYSEFKRLLSQCIEYLPPCIVKTFLEKVPYGYRYAACRLACVVAPALCHLDDSNFREMMEDFADRCNFAGVREYYWYYFTGEGPFGTRVATATKLDEAAYNLLRDLAKCDKCPYREECSMYRTYVLGVGGGKPIYVIVAEVLERCSTYA